MRAIREGWLRPVDVVVLLAASFVAGFVIAFVEVVFLGGGPLLGGPLFSGLLVGVVAGLTAAALMWRRRRTAGSSGDASEAT